MSLLGPDVESKNEGGYAAQGYGGCVCLVNRQIDFDLILIIVNLKRIPQNMPKGSNNFFGFLSHKKEHKHFFVSFYFLVSASSLAILFFAWGNKNWFTILSTSIVISIASFLVGVLLGFIFGFPHNENERHNKSFKDVTEWLTKIIIGLGLVELKKLYHLFNVDVLALSNSLKLGIDLSVLFGALIIGYAIMGFLIGYCVTITEILKLIVRANQEAEEMRAKAILKPVSGPDDEVTTDTPEDKDRVKIEESNLKELINILEAMQDYMSFDVAELKKLAVLLYKAKYYEMSAKAYEAAYEKDKSDYLSVLNAGYIYSKKLFRNDLANQLLDKLIADAPKYGAAYYNKACNYIRMNDFEKAKENIKLALTYDATLYEMTEKDEELLPIRSDIKKIFGEIRGE